MRPWHRCERFWREGFDCPYRELVEHKDKREEDDPDDEEPVRVPVPVPVPVPGPEPEPVDELEMVFERKKTKDPPSTPDILKVAEEIVKAVPWPYLVPPDREPVPAAVPAEPEPVPAVPNPRPMPIPDAPGGAPRLPVFGGWNPANAGSALVEATIAAGIGAGMAIAVPWLYGAGRLLPEALRGIGIEGELAFVEGTVARYFGKAALIYGAARMLGIPSSNRPVEEDPSLVERFPFHRGHFVNFTEYLDSELRRPELQGTSDRAKDAVLRPPEGEVTLDEDFS